MARNIRPQTSGVGSVKVLKTPKDSPSNNQNQTLFDLELKGSNFPADVHCGNVSSRNQNCGHQALVHKAYQPPGLTPGQGPLFPLLSEHQPQSSLNPGMSPRTPEHKTLQDLIKVASHLRLREPQNKEVSITTAQKHLHSNSPQLCPF